MKATLDLRCYRAHTCNRSGLFVSQLFLALLCVLRVANAAGEQFEFAKATPESEGFSSSKLDALKDSLAAKKTRALLIIRNDKVVYEWYAEGQTAKTKQGTASLAKAIVAGMSLAIAIQDGLISLDDPASKYVTLWKSDPQKSQITVRHLGSHTSGLDDSHNRDEQARGIDQMKYTGWAGDFWRWRENEPPQDAFSISRDVAPMMFRPGTDFQYSNPGIAMLGYCVTASLKGARHTDVRTLLRERIMRPIGVPDNEWSCGYGVTVTVDGLPLVAGWGGGSYTPRAVARLGRLVLREGDWDGRRLVSKEAIKAVTNDAGLPGHCGMGWWTNGDQRFKDLPKDAIWGLGAGHQILLVVPSLKLIMVRNGGDLFDRREKRERIGEVLFTPLLEALTESTKAEGSKVGSTPPYPRSRAIGGLKFDFSTHKRLAPGSDNWPLTWADDGHQYAAWGDGGGFGGTNQNGRVTLGVARIRGDANDYVGQNVWGGLNPENPAQFDGKSYGMLCVGRVLYMWRACQPGKHIPWCELNASTDHGAHWKPAKWKFTFEDGLTIPTFLNFGRDYAGARDDYVYSYYIQPTWGPGPSTTGRYGFDVHRPGRVYLSRVPKEKLLERDEYEFVGGWTADRQPIWNKDLSRKIPVFEDPNGVGWNLSVSFAPAVSRYLLCTEHSETHAGKLGVFDAPTPWGPWSTVAYEDSWGEGNIEVSTFFWSFSSKWFARDGRFTMVFTGKNTNDSWNTVQGRFLADDNSIPDKTSSNNTKSSSSPYSPSSVIDSIEWEPPEKIIRLAKGSDNWPLTWADDGHLYTAYGDGWGFEPKVPLKLSLGLARIEGTPSSILGVNIRSKDVERAGQGPAGVKASGMLMVDGMLYMWVRNAANAQLAWSSDRGSTWAWSDWKFTTSFACSTFLNFGQNYAGARDDYVYVYSHDSDSAYEPADRMVLARVAKDKIRDRSAYEFFERADDLNQSQWTGDIAKRGAVFEHPGRCYRSGITYNAGLKRYLWCQVFPETSHAQGTRFQGGFGIFDAPTPWGPWTTAFTTDAWDVGPGETNSLPTKWMSADGKTIHLVFSGDDHFSVRRGRVISRE